MLSQLEIKMARKTAQVLMEKYGEFLLILRERWTDERDYEDWTEYEAVIKAKVLAGTPAVKFVKASKRPFSFVVEIGKVQYTVSSTATADHCNMKEIK